MSERVLSLGGSTWKWWAVGMLLASLVAACDSAPPTTPSAPTGSSLPTSPPSSGAGAGFARYQLSGLVTDQAGAPVPEASLAVYHGLMRSSATAPPPSSCHSAQWGYCWFGVRAGRTGDYAAEFAAGPMTGRGFAGGGIGYVESHTDGYEYTVQWLPTTSATATLNLRLRRARTIRAGESTVVSVEPDSSLCTDGEDLWKLDYRCEVVRIESGAGALVVEARATQGTTVPSMFWYTSGSYTGGVRQTGPGTVSIPAGGGTYYVLVGLPEGSASQQFQVSTALQ